MCVLTPDKCNHDHWLTNRKQGEAAHPTLVAHPTLARDVFGVCGNTRCERANLFMQISSSNAIQARISVALITSVESIRASGKKRTKSPAIAIATPQSTTEPMFVI